jgi:hypothetical protein
MFERVHSKPWARLVALVILMTPASALAELKTTGEGKTQQIDPSQFNDVEKAGYQTFAARCTQCHAMSRPITALTSGRTPISGESFDREGIKKYVVKMMRKPNSGISREDAKAIIDFLTVARGIAEKSS